MTHRYVAGEDQVRDDQRRRWDDKHAERRSVALLDVPPTPDIAALEAAAESLTRFGDMANAIALWAIILRMRGELDDE